MMRIFILLAIAFSSAYSMDPRQPYDRLPLPFTEEEIQEARLLEENLNENRNPEANEAIQRAIEESMAEKARKDQEELDEMVAEIFENEEKEALKRERYHEDYNDSDNEGEEKLRKRNKSDVFEEDEDEEYKKAVALSLEKLEENVKSIKENKYQPRKKEVKVEKSKKYNTTHEKLYEQVMLEIHEAENAFQNGIQIEEDQITLYPATNQTLQRFLSALDGSKKFEKVAQIDPSDPEKIIFGGDDTIIDRRLENQKPILSTFFLPAKETKDLSRHVEDHFEKTNTANPGYVTYLNEIKEKIKTLSEKHPKAEMSALFFDLGEINPAYGETVPMNKLVFFALREKLD